MGSAEYARAVRVGPRTPNENIGGVIGCDRKTEIAPQPRQEIGGDLLTLSIRRARDADLVMGPLGERVEEPRARWSELLDHISQAPVDNIRPSHQATRAAADFAVASRKASMISDPVAHQTPS